jgi:hypothetical protein
VLCNPFLGNGSVNTFPLQRITHTTIELLLETVFSTRSVQSGYKEDNWGDPVSCQLTGISARETVKIGFEGGKLKNLHS